MSKIWIKPQQVDITQDPGLSPPVVPKEDLGLGFVDANSTFTTSTPSTPLTNTVNNIYITRGPRGRDGQVQFNEDGSYTGDPGLLYEPNSDTLTTGTLDVNQLNANRANLGSINYLTILGGNNRDVLKTNGSGVITWASAFPSDVGNSGKFLMTNGISQQWAHPSYTNLVDVPSNIATQSYVGNAIANLVDSSPAALNTLNELATALGNNANYATDITNILANKANVTYVDNKLANITWANLTGRPTIPDAQINSDWTETNVASKAFIQNKPTLGNISNINISGSSSQVFYGNGIFASLPAEVNLGNLTFNGNNLSSTSNVVIITTNGADGLTQLENKHINGDTYVWLDEGNVKIEADGNVWTFANSGNLMLPAGGDILDSTGNSVLGVSGANTGNITFSGNEIGSTGNFINITSTTGYVQLENLDSTNGSTYIYLQEGNVFVENNEGTWTFHNTGSLLFPETSNVEFAIVINDTLGEMSISTDSGNIAIWPENSKWLFGADGNLTLPANTFSVNYANGTQVSLGGGGGANTGNITFSDTTMASTNGNVKIGFSPSASPAVEFTFTDNGNLVLPQGTILSETANSTTITPPNALAGQGLVVRLTGVQGIVSDHPGGFTDGDTITLTVTPDYGSAQVTGTLDYTFTGATSVQLGRALTGTLTFTNEVSKPISWTIPVSSTMTTFTVTISNASGFTITSVDNTLTLSTTGSTEDHHIHLIAGDPSITDIYLGDDDQYVKIEKNGGNVVIGTDTNNKQWTFDTNGALTFPGGETFENGQITATANGQAMLADNALNNFIWVDSNGAYIETDDGTENTWTFGDDGNLSMPGNTVVSTPDNTSLRLRTSNNEYGSTSIEFVSDINGPHPYTSKVEVDGDGVKVHNSGDTVVWSFSGGTFNLPNDSTGNGVIYSNVANAQLYTDRTGNAQVSIRSKGIAGDKTWAFKDNGEVQFPDNTLQTTAYRNRPLTNLNLDGGSASVVFEIDMAFVDGGGSFLRGILSQDIYDGNDGGATITQFDKILDGGQS